MISKYINYYKSACKFGDLINAFISNVYSGKKDNEFGVYVKSVWSFRNLASKDKTLLTNEYMYNGSSVVPILPTPSNNNVILSSFHESGISAYMILEKDKTYILFNSKSGLSSILNIEELDLHGKVYSDETLSSFCWSKDGSYIAYTAEKKRPKPTSFFTIESQDKSNQVDGKGEEHRYIDDWGEQMEGQHTGTIAVVNVKELTINVVDLPENYLVGEVCWSLDGKLLYGIAYVKKAFRLGLIYCPIRENIIFSIDMNGHFKEMASSEDKFSMNSPRLSPDGKSLAFLRNPAGGPHVRNAQLCTMDVQTEEVRVVINYVDTSIKDSNENLFHGLYGCSALPKNCWCLDSKRLFISSFSHTESTIILVNTETRSFEVLQSDCSQKVLDVQKDFVLISRSSFLKPALLLIGRLEDSNSINFRQLNDDREIDVDSIHICRRTCEGVPHPGKASDLPVPYMYLGRTEKENGKEKSPLIVLLHGGPHSLIVNSFSNQIHFFLKLGYSFVIPNYRGSLGQGRKSIQSLPGCCGTADVTDVHACVQHCFAEFGDVIDNKRINLLGGSHGGFLVTHIAGQFPDLVHRVVSLNPVIDLSSMALTSDIPDWVFTESGFPYQVGQIANTNEAAAMFGMSPLSHVDKVKAPILLQLGKNDRRVPYMQGLLYHKKLLARGIKTEAFVYDDCHPLRKVDVEADCQIHAAQWFASED